MKEFVANIEKQVDSCRQLLSVFQDERHLYEDGDNVPVASMRRLLERKAKIMEVFEEQQKIIRALRAEAGERPQNPQGEERRKNVLRNLAGVLEQLLVIDHENEKLLRDSVGNRSQAAGGRQRPERQRPALLRRHPFVPGGAAAVSAPASPFTAPEQRRKAEALGKTAPRARLRDYAEIGKNATLSYA